MSHFHLKNRTLVQKSLLCISGLLLLLLAYSGYLSIGVLFMSIIFFWLGTAPNPTQQEHSEGNILNEDFIANYS